MFKIPKSVQVTEVGPRDGLQNEKKILSLENKLLYLEKLCMANVSALEVTSFVNPKKVPQMENSVAVFSEFMNKIHPHYPHIRPFVLVPNEKGYTLASDLGATHLAFITAVSETFCRRNTDCTQEESFKRVETLVAKATEDKKEMRVYVSTVFGCPYEGEMDLAKSVQLVQRLKALGVKEISLGDTIGIATPYLVEKLINELGAIVGLEGIAMHFHDTRGMAIANTLMSLHYGICQFDSSSGGIGGCPYALGATGNMATEELVYLLNSFHIHHGVELNPLLKASKFIFDVLGTPSTSKYVQMVFREGGPIY